MALTGGTFSIVASVIPVALIACGSAYGIHVMTHYYIAVDKIKAQCEKEKREFTIEDHKKAIVEGLGNVSLSVVLSLKSLESIGKRAKLMEKVIEQTKKKISKQHRNTEESHSVSNTLYSIYTFFCGTRPRLAVSSLVLLLISGIGIAKEKGEKIYKKAEALEEEAKKSGKEIKRSKKEKIDRLYAQANHYLGQVNTLPDMTNPEALQEIDLMEEWLNENYKEIGKAITYTDSLKKINQVWNSPSASAPESSGSESSSSSADDFGFGADDFGFGDIASDFDFGDTATTQEVSKPARPFEDPNAKHRENLAKQMTAEDVQKLIKDAFAHSSWELKSIDDLVEAIHREMNFNGWAYYEIPNLPEKYMVDSEADLASIISNYNILLGDSIKLFADDLTSYHPKVIRMQVQLHTHSTQVVGKMLKEIEEYAKANLPEGYVMEATGQGEMEFVMTNLVVSSQLSSLLMSLILVILIIAISFKSLIAGLIGAIPLAFTIILNYMMMGFLGIKLDLITSIIASVAIGVGIDYTIHFMTEYRELRKNCTNLAQITQDTFKSNGMGIITNALAVGLGFLVLCLSRFVVLRYIGILIAIVMFTSSMLAMTIIPGIFNAFDPDFLHKGKPKAWFNKDTQDDDNREVIAYVKALARVDSMEHEKGTPIAVPEDLIREIAKKHGANIDEKLLFDTYIDTVGNL